MAAAPGAGAGSGRAFSPPGSSAVSAEEAWKLLGLNPGANRAAIKKAYRQKIVQVHPDVIGDDGAQLKLVQDAYAVVKRLADPTDWDVKEFVDGLPNWAAEFVKGVKWTDECPSFAAFLEKQDQKALAVGAYNPETGMRPWAAAWGKYTQEDANTEALRVCRQGGSECRLIYVGSGAARRGLGARAGAAIAAAAADEERWWMKRFGDRGNTIGFGWMPEVDKEREKVIGSINVEFTGNMVRVPVFREVVGSRPYYYSPIANRKKKIYVEGNFKHELTGKRRALNRRRIMDQELAKKNLPGHGRVHYSRQVEAEMADMMRQRWQST